MKLTLKLPDVNEGRYMFTVNAEGEIIYGLGAIKGLGEGPIESILEARQQSDFKDLFDFCARTDPRRVNRRAIDAMIRSGAFDSLGEDRAVLMAAVDDALKAAQQSAENTARGMEDLFGDPARLPADVDVYANYRKAKPWPPKQRLAGERDTLGLYVTGHPIDEYEQEVRKFAPCKIADLRADGSRSQVVAGLVVAARTMKTKRGDTMAILSLDDRSARIEVTILARSTVSSGRC